MNGLGLSRDPKLVVLSSVHHYYYDAEDMTSVRTVVNLKEFNQIKEINQHASFHVPYSASQMLPDRILCRQQKTERIFTQEKITPGSDLISEEEKNGIVSRIPFLNTIFTILDAKAHKYLSERIVTQLFTKNGFNVMDMTELEGLTFFLCSKQRCCRQLGKVILF